MEIKIDLDIAGIISSVVSAEKVKPIVEKAILSSLESAISSSCGYNSEFQKALKQQLSEAMPHGLSIDDIAKFQFMMNAAVSTAAHGANAATIQTAMNEMVKHVIPDVPTRVKLSELLEQARDAFLKEKHEAFYARYEPSEYGGGWLYLDDDEKTKEKYRADIHFAVNKGGEVYALTMKGENITPKSMPSVISKFESLLMSMYVGRTSLEIDIDEDDVRAAAEEQYE